MASEDVIELGSSDDDTEPAPKRKKPIPNAMVHIPSKLPGLTIKPSKTTLSTNKVQSPMKPKANPSTNKAASPMKPKATSSTNKAPPVPTRPTTTKTSLKVNPLNRSKPSITAVRVPIQNKILLKKDAKIVPSPNKAISINPISIAQSLSKTQVVLKKVIPLKRPRAAMEIKQPNVLSGLSPSVTIKPIKSAGVTFKPVQIVGGSAVTLKKRRIVPKRKEQSEVLTVELDDDDTPESATASPQWYLRPEEQSKKEAEQEKSKEAKETWKKKKDESSMEVNSTEPSMEEKNNKEPDTTKYFEITIEDSPLKPIHRHPDIGKELPITIEDSPVKPVTKATNNVESDCEMNEEIGDKHSKKKLNYPKQSKNCQQNNVVEIEIDFQDTSCVVETETSPKNKLNENKESPKNKPKDSEKSPKNTPKESEKPEKQSESEKVNNSKTSGVAQAKEIVMEDKEIVIEDNKIVNNDKEIVIDDKEIVIEDDEFHPTYQKFINLCFKLENSEDMKKIVEKKIKSYYRQCPKDYVESEEFLDMVSSKIISMEASPAKMYLYIKDIVDELNLQRKMQKSVVSDKVEMEKESTNTKYYEESLSKYDSKKQRQIRKLEKTIKKLHRAIQKLEEQEVDFDDDEDSVYLLTERYKERMVRVHAKFCQLTNTKMPSEPRIHIEARPGRPTGPAKKLEKWINRKVPIGTPLPFPDFHDVLRCVRAANEEDKLGWNDVDIMEEARDLFTRCGKKLQRRRQENEWRIAASRISAEVDPAENSLELKKKLDENKTVAAKKETELLNKYVDRQNLLKLEAVEIGDKEAEESPLESEEEEEEDVGENDNALDNKEKRKLRLKRLIKEKNKRGEEKENAEKKDSEEKNDKAECEDETSKSNVQDKANEQISEEISDSVESELLPSETKKVRKEDKQESNTGKDSEKENGNDEKENKKDENKDSESNDSDYKVECDIDELHLLQKLHSENEANSSTADSSDSDSPIPISDSLDSNSNSEIENGGKMCDVISIENSSYSESEMIIDGSSKDGSESFKKQKVEELVSANFEIEYSSTGIEESNKETATEEAVEMVDENILLACSDEEENDSADNVSIESTCINLKDDNISITETTVDGEAFEGENVSNDDKSLPETNDRIDATEENSSVKNSHFSLATAQEIIKDSGHTSDKRSQLGSNVDTEMIDINDSPKEDVVDIRSASDGNSVESTDIQADDTEIIKDSDNASDKTTQQCSNVDTEMIDINDSPEGDVVDIRSASDVNSVQADDTNKEDISEAPGNMDISEPINCEQSEVTQTVTL